MKKIADIRAFELMQNGANRSMGLSSELSIFNDQDAANGYVEYLGIWTDGKEWDDIRALYNGTSSKSLASYIEETAEDITDRMFNSRDGRDIFTAEELATALSSKLGDSVPKEWIENTLTKPIMKMACEDYDIQLDEADPIELDDMGNELHPLSEDWQNNYAEDKDDDADYGYDNYGLDPDRYDGMDDNDWDY